MSWIAWGKRTQSDAAADDVGVLDLISHCLDVAAVVLALMQLPVIRSRFEHLANRPLSQRDLDRLAVLAFLHDIGKASRGFQSKALLGEERKNWLGTIQLHECGHTHAVGALFHDDQLCSRFCASFPVEEIARWHPDFDEFSLWMAAISHHGTPINIASLDGRLTEVWKRNALYDPFDTLKELGETAQGTWPDAFEQDRIVLPAAPAFTHAFAGLVSLADWIGSETQPLAFPYDLAPVESRWGVAKCRAKDVLRNKRIDLQLLQTWLSGKQPAFGEVFVDPRTHMPYAPTPLQYAMSDPSLGPLVVVEAETGSGKTEAALWRFKTLFEAGEVDSLAFVLPTRVAAVQIEQRIRNFIEALFPDQQHRPNVVLAVPGYLRVDGVDADARLPGFKVLWPDKQHEELAHLRWAAESSKRYLAASCAVGTIDQVLLSGLPARHAHLRGFSLLRSLLVVDEVHASDRYMIRILQQVLDRHIKSGGHALLLSATLGVAARDELLALGRRPLLREAPERESAPYPAITDSFGSREIPTISSTDHNKRIRVILKPWMQDAAKIAQQAADAVSGGARVLIVRNTVNGVIEVQKALEEVLGLNHPALFRCNGVVCPHHGRFAAEDRRVLDEAVNDAFGKNSPAGARVLCGSQTLEQSLDIDCDLLITDIAPIDVLLQRFGRLHRHRRERAQGYTEPVAIVLTPPERDLQSLLGGRRGLHGIGGRVYENVLSIEATWREMAQREVLSIPMDNRVLVERCTDPQTLMALAESLGDAWLEHWQLIEGRDRARGGEAAMQALDWDTEWRDTIFPRAAEERIRTRLGADALRVTLINKAISPFGQSLQEIAVPAWMAGGIEAAPVAGFETAVLQSEARFEFALEDLQFEYSRLGLRRKGQ